MSDLHLTSEDAARLAVLAAVLIPAAPPMPGAADVAAFQDLLRTAVRACGHSDADVRAAVDRIPEPIDWEQAKTFATEAPRLFQIASELVSAAYYMAPAVLAVLKFPRERRHPAGQEDFANEYETGILEPVMARGRLFREV